MVDLERFARSTSQQRTFRKPRRRLVAEGYRVARERPPHPSALLNEIEQVSGEWLSLPGRRERAFALGRFDRSYLQRTRLVVARRLERTAGRFPQRSPRRAPGCRHGRPDATPPRGAERHHGRPLSS